MESNQMCGHVMLLPSYFFSHYVLLTQVCGNLTKWNKVAVICDKSVHILKMKLYSSSSASCM